MKYRIVTLFTLALMLSVSPKLIAGNQGGGKHFVFNLVGTGYQYADTVPDPESGGEMDALCFDVALVNLKNRQIIGTASDCLSEIENAESGTVFLTGTTYFHLPQGTLITQGKTTVAAVEQTTVTPGAGDITHITGASGTGNAIVGGTRRFAKSTGTARLSGMVNLSDFTMEDGDPITFDCIFVIDLD
ncbi:MAG: hypothetical protein V7754_22085 [Halioglobus sp.]